MAKEEEGANAHFRQEKHERMRDGRIVYLGSEKIDDVTRHPAFRNAAATVAEIMMFQVRSCASGRTGVRGRWRMVFALLEAVPHT